MTGLILAFLLSPIILYYIVNNWQKLAYRKLEVNVKLGAVRVFVNEEFDYSIQLTNKKVLPLSWIEADVVIPREMTIKGQNITMNRSNETSSHIVLLSLMWFQRITRVYRASFSKRGYYTVNDSVIKTGDYFGIRNYEKNYDIGQSIIVYPSIKPIEDLVIENKSLSGESIVRRWINDDPTYFSGVREYTYREPLKSIHWIASAKTGTLQVKQNQFTADKSVVFIINIQCSEVVWQGNDSEMIERLVEIGASYIDKASRENIACGIATNSLIAGEKFGSVVVEPGLGSRHNTLLFDTLAKITAYRTVSIEKTLELVTSKMDTTSIISLITPIINPEIVEMLKHGYRRGFSFQITTTKEQIEKNKSLAKYASIYLVKEEGQLC